MVDRKVRYKMYKSGRNWVIAGIVSTSFLGTSVLFSQQVAKASVTNNDQSYSEKESTGITQKSNS